VHLREAGPDLYEIGIRFADPEQGVLNSIRQFLQALSRDE